MFMKVFESMREYGKFKGNDKNVKEGIRKKISRQGVTNFLNQGTTHHKLNIPL